MPARLGTLLPKTLPVSEPAPDAVYRTCPTGLHGTIEPLVTPSGRYVPGSCECMRDALRQRLDVEAQSKQHAVLKSLCYNWLTEGHASMMSNELAEKTLATFCVQDSAVAYAACLKYTQGFLNAPGNMLLYGLYGRGKTHLVAGICNAIIEQYGLSCRFLIATEFMSLLQSVDLAQKYSLIHQAKETRFLVLDDVDKVPQTETRESVYADIINFRHNHRLPTAITTNTLVNLKFYIGEAAESRMAQGMLAIHVEGFDHRR